MKKEQISEEKKKINLSKLARELGVSRVYIYDLMSGKAGKCRTALQQKIRAALRKEGL